MKRYIISGVIILLTVGITSWILQEHDKNTNRKDQHYQAEKAVCKKPDNKHRLFSPGPTYTVVLRKPATTAADERRIIYASEVHAVTGGVSVVPADNDKDHGKIKAFFVPVYSVYYIKEHVSE